MVRLTLAQFMSILANEDRYKNEVMIDTEKLSLDAVIQLAVDKDGQIRPLMDENGEIPVKVSSISVAGNVPGKMRSAAGNLTLSPSNGKGFEIHFWGYERSATPTLTAVVDEDGTDRNVSLAVATVASYTNVYTTIMVTNQGYIYIRGEITGGASGQGIKLTNGEAGGTQMYSIVENDDSFA